MISTLGDLLDNGDVDVAMDLCEEQGWCLPWSGIMRLRSTLEKGSWIRIFIGLESRSGNCVRSCSGMRSYPRYGWLGSRSNRGSVSRSPAAVPEQVVGVEWVVELLMNRPPISQVVHAQACYNFRNDDQEENHARYLF